MFESIDQTTLVITVGLMIGVPAVFAFVIGIIVFVGRSRPQPGLGPRSATDGRWNAMLLDGPLAALGGTLGATGGTLAVEHGFVSFLQDGAIMPAWSYRCADVAVRTHSAFARATMTLWTPAGEVRMTVSRERINRWSENDIKTLREPRYAVEVARVLAANGARVV